MTAEGEKVEPLFKDSEWILSPTWSLDGRFIAYGNTTGNYLYNIASGLITRLTPKSLYIDTYFFGQPKWLPGDGHFLSIDVAMAGCSGLCFNIYQLQTDKGELSLGDLSRPFMEIDGPYSHPVWSPNRDWLIAATDIHYSKRISTEEHYRSTELVFWPINPTIFNSRIKYYSLSLTDGQMLTQNNFYDNDPDWTP